MRRAARVEKRGSIRNQPVFGPIAAADHVAGTRSRNGHPVAGIVVRSEKRSCDRRWKPQFGTGLAVAVGVEAAQPVALAIRPGPLAILIAFVGGDNHDRTQGVARPGLRQARARCPSRWWRKFPVDPDKKPEPAAAQPGGRPPPGDARERLPCRIRVANVADY